MNLQKENSFSVNVTLKSIKLIFTKERENEEKEGKGGEGRGWEKEGKKTRTLDFRTMTLAGYGDSDASISQEGVS